MKLWLINPYWIEKQKKFDLEIKRDEVNEDDIDVRNDYSYNEQDKE